MGNQQDIQNNMCGLCGVTILHLPLGFPPTMEHHKHSNFVRNNRCIVLSIATIYPITNSPPNHPNVTMGVLDVLCARTCSRSLPSLPRNDAQNAASPKKIPLLASMFSLPECGSDCGSANGPEVATYCGSSQWSSPCEKNNENARFEMRME